MKILSLPFLLFKYSYAIMKNKLKKLLIKKKKSDVSDGQNVNQ